MLWPNNVWAQTVMWEDEKQLYQPVEDRLPDELKHEPLTHNGLQYSAEIDVETRYDDNILAQPNEESDAILAVTPKLTINKNYKAHQFTLGLESTIERFADRTSENKEDVSVFARGKLYKDHKWEIPALIRFDKRARLRDKPQTVLSAEPLDIKRLRAETGITRNFNRLSVSLLGEYQNYHNEDGAGLNTATPAIFSDNDRDVYTGKLKFRYELPDGSPGDEGPPRHVLFADFLYGQQNYDKRRFTGGTFSGASGDRDEYGVLAGIESHYKGLLFTKFGLGYTRQNFDDSSLSDISNIDLEADIAFNITPKWTLGLNAGRDINQDSGFTQGITETSVIFKSDYEILHDLYLKGELGYIDYAYEGIARDDEEYTADLGLTWYNSKRLESNFGVRWQDRDSNTANNSFDRIVFLMSLTGKL